MYQNVLYLSVYYLSICIVALFWYASRKRKSELVQQMHKIFFISVCLIFSGTVQFITDAYKPLLIMKSFNSLCFLLLAFQLNQFIITFTKNKISSVNILFKIFTILVFIDSVGICLNPWIETLGRIQLIPTGGIVVTQIIPNLYYSFHVALCYSIGLTTIIILIIDCDRVPLLYIGSRLLLILICSLTYVLHFLFIYFKVNWFTGLSSVITAAFAVFVYISLFRKLPSSVLHKTRNLIFESLDDGIVLFNYTDELIDFNDSAQKLFNLNRKEETIETLSFFLSQRLGINLEDKSLDTQKRFELLINEVWFSIQYIALIFNKKKHGTFLVFQNIDYSKKMFAELEKRALFDETSGLYNKEMLRQKIIEVDANPNAVYSVGVSNLNGLKLINDGYGSSMGDKAIVEAMNVMREELPPGSFAAKRDGDVIVILPEYTEKNAIALYERISTNIKSCDKLPFGLSIEYGIVQKRFNSERVEEIISVARNTMFRKKLMNKNSVHSSLIQSLRKSLETSNYETEQHAERTREMAVRLGQYLGLTDIQLSELALLAILHDIGKMSVPNHILLKSEPLTPEEKEIMKLHTIKGFIIANASSELSKIAEYILCHHERWDGTGYPNGYKGLQIPLLSRIISVVDSFDVMTHDRPYHKAISIKDALTEVKHCSGTQFDPDIACIFVSMIEGKVENS
jgi:diguanylate cyclase (GGDEF)-like protein